MAGREAFVKGFGGNLNQFRETRCEPVIARGAGEALFVVLASARLSAWGNEERTAVRPSVPGRSALTPLTARDERAPYERQCYDGSQTIIRLPRTAGYRRTTAPVAPSHPVGAWRRPPPFQTELPCPW